MPYIPRTIQLLHETFHSRLLSRLRDQNFDEKTSKVVENVCLYAILHIILSCMHFDSIKKLHDSSIIYPLIWNVSHMFFLLDTHLIYGKHKSLPFNVWRGPFLIYFAYTANQRKIISFWIDFVNSAKEELSANAFGRCKYYLQHIGCEELLLLVGISVY